MGGVEYVPVDRYGEPYRDDRYGADRYADSGYPDPRYGDPRAGDRGYRDAGQGDAGYADERYRDPYGYPIRRVEADPYGEADPYRQADPYRDRDPYREPDRRRGPDRSREADRYAAEDDSAYYRQTRATDRKPASADRSSADRSAAGRHRAGARPYAGRERRRTLPLWQEIPLLLIIAFVLATVIKTFVVQAFYIPSGSMEQTLLVSDRVLVNKFVYDMREPRRGEVVVFRGTDSWAPESGIPQDSGTLATVGRMLGGLIGAAPPDEKDFVKRVIGVGGDTVQCCDANGRVEVNGVPLVEPYVFEDTPIAQRPFGPVTVPRGRLFMMGDHRVASADSRVYLNDQWRGTIPVDAVIGQAYATAWPASRWGLLQAPDTFSNVPTALGDPSRGEARPTGAVALVVLPILFGPFGGVCAGRAPRWLLRPDSRRRRRLRW
ncbi:signal peptidase I [Cryptosporangium minutisporangium]|uniref:Signal peptidase I n=1 Tax=Cryptosporangium minutisporangium TaxID=113569 RepID=A0ABP6T3L9_9ACTN